MRPDRQFAHRIFLLAIATMAFVATPAAAQWAWREDSGRVMYSDRPPPPNIKMSQILRQPAAAAQATPATSTPSATGVDDAGKEKESEAKSASAPKTLAEREMDFRKRQQERATAERKAQEEQQKSSAKAAECERARGYLRALEDGQRIARTDASGNREFLDDAQRATETERARKLVQASCN